jgi:hypothetical protein
MIKNSSFTLAFLLFTLPILMGGTPVFGQHHQDEEFFLLGIQTPDENEAKIADTIKFIQEQLKKHLLEKGWQHTAHDTLKSLSMPIKNDAAQEKLLQEKTQEAGKAYEDGSIETALPLYLEAIHILTQLNRPSPQHIQTLAQLRLTTANRLLALEGFETKANQLLRDALKANPHLELNAAQYPPRLRKRFAQIRNEWAKEKKNNFLIRSTPSEAVVFLEGHSVGLTPLHLLNHLSAGTYRLWVEKEGVRTTTRRLTVKAETVDEYFDFQTNYYFKAATQSFHLDPQEIQLHAFLTSLQKHQTNSSFILTGILASDDAWDMFSIKVDQTNISYITTMVPSLSEKHLLSASQQHAQAITAQTLEILPNDNFFNPKAVQIQNPKISQWQAWGLLGLSTLVLGATVSAAFLLWPTAEEEGHLQISVVP